MAIQTVERLKGWFKTGEYPTEQQFSDWLDSYRHKSEQIAIGDVTGLVQLLQTKMDADYMDVRIRAAIEANNSTSTQLPYCCNGLCRWRRKCKCKLWYFRKLRNMASCCRHYHHIQL